MLRRPIETTPDCGNSRPTRLGSAVAATATSAVESSAGNAAVEAATSRAMESAGGLTVTDVTVAVGAATVVVASSVVAAVADASVVAEGIESPAEGAIEGIWPNKGVAVDPWVPVPAGGIASGGIVSGQVGIGFGQVFGSQAAPVVKLVLARTLIEVLRPGSRAFVEGELMALIDCCPLARSDQSSSLALVDLSDVIVGVEFVETSLEKLGRDACFDDLHIILGMDLIDLNCCPSLFEFNLGVGEIGRDHFDGAVVVETQVDSRREKDFCVALSGGEHLAGFERDCSDRVLSHGLSSDKRGALNVVDCSWTGWVRAEGRRGQSRQGEDKKRFHLDIISLLTFQ